MLTAMTNAEAPQEPLWLEREQAGRRYVANSERLQAGSLDGAILLLC
jgi:hypothetical protein